MKNVTTTMSLREGAMQLRKRNEGNGEVRKRERKNGNIGKIQKSGNVVIEDETV